MEAGTRRDKIDNASADVAPWPRNGHMAANHREPTRCTWVLDEGRLSGNLRVDHDVDVKLHASKR
jgi:hypothetical protein